MATILVVDDRPVDRELLVTLFGYAGHRVLEAADGAEALRLARAERPDLVIADVLMPGMDGYELVRRMRAEPATAQTKVVFYSAAYREREAQALAQACGVSHLLLKPTEPHVLLRTIQEVLASTGPTPAPVSADFDRAHVRLLGDKLARSAQALEAANARLTALIDLGLQLASEVDPRVLLDRYCRAACELLRARAAAVGVVNDDGQTLRHVSASGLDDQQAGQLRALRADQGVLGLVMAQRQAVRLYGRAAAAEARDLPTGSPAPRAFLGTPVASPTHVYGWLYCVDKVGGEGFSDEDESLAGMLAAQFALAYENLQRYDLLRLYATELEQRIAEARAAVRQRDEFISVAAHELKTPLTTLKGFAQFTLWQMDTKGELAPQFVRQTMQRVDAQANRLHRLMAALLDISRLDTGILALERELIDVVRVAESAAEAARMQARRHTVVVRAPTEARALVDPLRLEQVLANLLDNAIKFSPEGGQIGLEVSVPTPETVRLVVADQGIGIPPEHRPHLFQRFFQAHADTHRSGMGLGLYISRQIIELHGGQLEAEFPPEGGTRFVVSLPAGLAAQEQSMSPDESAPPPL